MAVCKDMLPVEHFLVNILFFESVTFHGDHETLRVDVFLATLGSSNIAGFRTVGLPGVCIAVHCQQNGVCIIAVHYYYHIISANGQLYAQTLLSTQFPFCLHGVLRLSLYSLLPFPGQSRTHSSSSIPQSYA